MEAKGALLIRNSWGTERGPRVDKVGCPMSTSSMVLQKIGGHSLSRAGLTQVNLANEESEKSVHLEKFVPNLKQKGRG